INLERISLLFKESNNNDSLSQIHKLIVSDYMTAFTEISRRARDRYHNLADDVMIKSIFNSRKSKDQQSREELEATQNVENVKEHLMTEEIKKLVEGSKAVEENVEVNSSPIRNDDNQTNPDTKLEPRSDKETLEVEITAVVPPVNVNDEEEESAEDDYELRRREKGKYVEEIRNIPSSTTIRSPRILTNLVSFDIEKLQELMETDPLPSSSTPSSSSPNSKLSLQTDSYHYSKPSLDSLPRRKFNEVAKNPEDIMMESLPKLVDDRIKVLLKKQVPLYVAEELILEREKSQADVDSSVRSYMTGHILHLYPSKDTPSSAQEQQYQLYLTMKDDPQLQKDDVSIWLALKIKFKRLQVAITPCRPSAVWPRDQDDPHEDAHLEGENIVQSCQRDPKAPGLPLVNQDLLYLKKGNSGPEKIVLSLHKFPAVIFPDNDIEERTFRWVDKCVKRFNPYARYGVEH
ncbi:hypothetical protein Tco_1413720, partial [Tanacetum coccineum]